MWHGQNIKCSWRAWAACPISPTGAGVIELLFCMTTTSDPHLPRRASTALRETHGYSTSAPSYCMLASSDLMLGLCSNHTWEKGAIGPVVVKFSDSFCCAIRLFRSTRPYLHNVTRAQGFCLNPTVNFWCNLAVSTIHRHEWNGIPFRSMMSLVKLDSSFQKHLFPFGFPIDDTNCQCKNITG